MAERSVEQIAAAQLNFDVAQAKETLRYQLETAGSTRLVDAIENLIGKVVIRWWFARICKNKAALTKLDQKAIEERRKVRGVALIAACATINEKANGGKAPANLDLQMGMMNLMAENRALWQAMYDAGIIHPDAKQDYLDDGVSELYAQVDGYSGTLDTGRPNIQALAARHKAN